MTQMERQCKMATRKDRKSKTKPRSKQRKSKFADECAFPGEQERLPFHAPGTYQVAMGTGEEIVAWLRRVPQNTQAILIRFSNEASYRTYGPNFWHLSHKLPEIVARIQRRRFEQLVETLKQLLPAPSGFAAMSGAKVRTATGALPRRRRGYAE